MQTKVFLSLSFVDAAFVRDVRQRLPRGLAYFYESSFENGEELIDAMERAVGNSSVFVLFASEEGLKSKAVQFEIANARLENIFSQGIRILVFPTSPNITYKDLPEWLQNYWVAKAGWTAADIARYITRIVLAPDVGLSKAAIKVTGRGKTLDEFDGIVADFISRNQTSPNVYILAGFTGVGRRTFAEYYMRRSLDDEANLPFGPSIHLPNNADIVEVYRALRSEIGGDLSPQTLAEDQRAFQTLDIEGQSVEVIRLLTHFESLGQAVRLISTSGFFEDLGHPKDWVLSLLRKLPPTITLFIISNRKFDDAVVDQLPGAVQMRVPELSDKDIRTLMTYTAQRMEVEDFKVSNELISAIGGHADIANAAVRLAKQKGNYVLEKDPAQLMNIQRTILGEAIDVSSMSATEKAILDVLCWLPSLGGDLLQEAVLEVTSGTESEFLAAIQSLLLGCLIYANDTTFSISPSIRHLYRRWHVTPAAVSTSLGRVLSDAWADWEENEIFREDVLEASVFIYALEGKNLPEELKNLISPGLLEQIVRDTYAKGKDNDDQKELRRSISLGEMATEMPMSEATREEILSTVARAQIRVADYDAATRTITNMRSRSYRSVAFLEGHKLRRQGKYDAAIPILKEAITEYKNNRAAIHELALAFQRSQKFDDLARLLKEQGSKVSDSAMLTDFQIGLDLARGSLKDAQSGINRLRSMADDDGRADRREAQLLMKHGSHGAAKRILSNLLDKRSGGAFHVRSLRATAAAWDRDFGMARRDIDWIKGLPDRAGVVIRLEAELYAAQGKLAEADALLSTLPRLTPQDWLLKARILDLKADLPTTGVADRQNLKKEALELRVQHGSAALEVYDD